MRVVVLALLVLVSPTIAHSSALTSDFSLHDRNAVPYKYIGLLSIRHGTRDDKGTGFLISDCHVLTNAHVAGSGPEEARRIYFEFGARPGNRETFKYKSEAIIIGAGWKRAILRADWQDADYKKRHNLQIDGLDWAILKLETCIPTLTQDSNYGYFLLNRTPAVFYAKALAISPWLHMTTAGFPDTPGLADVVRKSGKAGISTGISIGVDGSRARKVIYDDMQTMIAVGSRDCHGNNSFFHNTVAWVLRNCSPTYGAGDPDNPSAWSGASGSPIWVQHTQREVKYPTAISIHTQWFNPFINASIAERIERCMRTERIKDCYGHDYYKITDGGIDGLYFEPEE